MLRNYLLIALRRLSRERLYSFINVLGLSLGIGCCLLIYLLLRHESSFDAFQAKADRLYQVSYRNFMPKLDGNLNDPEISPILPTPLGQTMKEEMPEVLRATAFNGFSGTLQRGEHQLSEEGHFVSADFLEMFSFELLAGQAGSALDDPDELVLTQRLAQKLFGQEDPMGKTVKVRFYGQNHLMRVSAVVADPPTNTNLRFHYLVSVKLRPYYQDMYGSWNSLNTYFLLELAPHLEEAHIQASLDRFHESRWGEQNQQTLASLDLPEGTKLGELVLTPLAELHLRPEISWRGVVDPQYGLILGSIALLILVIATINYISLGMAQAGKRLREVGVRKVLGAYSAQVVWQFLGEALLLSLLAMTLAVAWVELTLPFSSELLGRSVQLSLLDQPMILLALLGLSLLVGLIAGAYPAIFMARFSPVGVLKSHQQVKVRTNLTKALVVLQYSLTIFLIVSSLLMNRQMRYVSQKDLGFNHDQVVAIPTGAGWTDQGEKLYQQMTTALASQPDVHAVSATSLTFARGWSRYSNNFDGQSFYAYCFRVDPSYLDALAIEVVEGRNFRADRITDSSQIIINQKLADQLGWEDPIGRNLPLFGDEPGPQIVGVVKDYHIFSLDQPIEPVALHMDSTVEKFNYLYIKISPQRQAETVAAIRETYERLQPEVPFEYRYLDEDLAEQYEEHQRRSHLMRVSTGFAILIACLGLFALASLSAANRTREIGIRKVFGADIGRLLLLLNRDIIALALIAFAIGAPLAAWLMQDWLAQFVYRIEIDASLFLLALLMGLGLALLTVSYQVIRVALTKPAEALRHE